MVLVVAGVIFLVIGSYFGWIQWQLTNKIGTGYAFARLTSKNYKQNVKVRTGRTVKKTAKDFTDFVYTYSVNGKEYKIKGSALTSPRNLPQMPSVIYLIKAPHHGQIPGYSMDNSLLFALLGIGEGAFILIIGLVLLLF